MIPDNARKWLEKYYPIVADFVSRADALEHSILKWRGLQLPILKQHGLKTTRSGVHAEDAKVESAWFYADAQTCALCQHYYDSDQGCPSCPLVLKARPDHIGCEKEYEKFLDGNPAPMLNALLQARRRQQRKRNAGLANT